MLANRWLGYGLVGCAALLTWWLVQTTDDKEIQHSAQASSVDFYSVGYRKKQTAEDGTVKSLLLADGMTHFAGDESTHLTNPDMTLYQTNTPPWRIKAETGVLAADGDNLQLIGKAWIHRDGGKRIKPLTVNTANLRVKIATHYAETDEWAELISPPNKTTGTGLKGFFASPVHFKLLSKVKGRYELN